MRLYLYKIVFLFVTCQVDKTNRPLAGLLASPAAMKSSKQMIYYVTVKMTSGSDSVCVSFPQTNKPQGHCLCGPRGLPLSS